MISKDDDVDGEVKSIAPEVTSDEEQLRQQRELKRGTKSRGNL